jgi:hypothetical protein
MLVFTAYTMFLHISFMVKLVVMATALLIFNLAVHLSKSHVWHALDLSIAHSVEGE